MAVSTYNQYALANHPTFLARVEMALIGRAMYLLALEGGASPPPAAELQLAHAIVGISGPMPSGTSHYAGRMAKLVAADTTLENNVRNDVSGGDISEGQLETAVATHFAKLA